MLLFILPDDILALDLGWLQRTWIRIEDPGNTLLERGRLAVPGIGYLHMIGEVEADELSPTPRLATLASYGGHDVFR